MSKQYKIEGKAYKLREVLTLADWEKSNRIDEAMKKVNPSGTGFQAALTETEFIQLMEDVLIDPKGAPITAETVRQIPMAEATKIFCDFFLVYLKMSADSYGYSKDFEKEAKGLLSKLKA
jgi:hypothetical protein